MGYGAALQRVMEHDDAKKSRVSSKPHHHLYRYLVPLQSALGSHVIAVKYEKYQSVTAVQAHKMKSVVASIPPPARLGASRIHLMELCDLR